MKATKRNCTCNIEVSNGTKSVTYQVCEFADKSEFLARVENDFPDGGAYISKIEDWAGYMFVVANNCDDEEYMSKFGEYARKFELGDTWKRGMSLPVSLLPDDFFKLNDVKDEYGFEGHMENSILCDGGYWSTIKDEVEFFNDNFSGVFTELGLIIYLMKEVGVDLEKTISSLLPIFNDNDFEYLMKQKLKYLFKYDDAVEWNGKEIIDLHDGTYLVMSYC